MTAGPTMKAASPPYVHLAYDRKACDCQLFAFSMKDFVDSMVFIYEIGQELSMTLCAWLGAKERFIAPQNGSHEI